MALNIPRLDMNKLREAASATKEKKGPSNAEGLYPFWNTPIGKTTILRFLPDADTNNTKGWWHTQYHHKLKFIGIAGGDLSKPVEVKVPSLANWGEADPIMKFINSQNWWKDENYKKIASQYWKKGSDIMQFFVREDGVGEENPPENPIRRSTFNGKLTDIVKGVLNNEDLEHPPVDPERGFDFMINITKGSYGNDYTTSQFRILKQGPLKDSEYAAIEKYGLNNLSSFGPKRPDEDQLAAIWEMFEASLNGEAYDPDRWSKFYRPPGLMYNRDNNSDSNTSYTSTPVAQPTQQVVQQPVYEEVVEVVSQPSEAITSSLDALKARIESNKAPETVSTITETSPVVNAAPKQNVADLMQQIQNRVNANKKQ